MDTNRLWLIGMIAVIAVVGVAGWMLGISPVLAQVSAANDQVASITAANTTSQSQLGLLKTQYAHIDTAQTELAGLRASIPTDGNMSEFLQELNTLSAKDGVTVQNVGVTDALLYAQSAAGTAAATTDTSTSTSTPTPTPTPTPTTAPTTPVTPVVPVGGLVTIPVQISVHGSFENVMAFVGDLQTGLRLFYSPSLAVAGSGTVGDNAVTGNITGLIYAQTGLSGALPDSITKAATPTPTPAPTETPTPSMTPTAPPLSTSTPTPTGTPKP